MLKLWGRTSSINVQKAYWAILELKLPHERVDAGGAFGIVETPAYKALNPNSRVPTIEDDGFVLWESNAIVRYLAAKHGAGTLWPTDLKVRADADRWMDWQTTMLSPAMFGAFWGLIRTPPEKRDVAAIEKSRQDTAALVALLEPPLAKRKFVAGDAFTMGDIPVGAAVHRWLNLPIERPAAPSVEAYYKRIMEREPARKALTKPVT
jgi:glutathione S-transferase